MKPALRSTKTPIDMDSKTVARSIPEDPPAGEGPPIRGDGRDR